MTDPTIITGKYGTLTVRTTTADDRISLLITNPSHGSVLGLTVPTAALLAAIDAHDPDAMRAYLRETAPEVIADLYRPEIPEADSPEDVDEHPEPVIAVTPEALDAAEQLGRYVAEIRDAFARGIAR